MPTKNRKVADIDTASITDFAVPTKDLDVNNHKIINITNPTSAQDAATKSYVDSQIASGGGSYQPLDSDLTAIASLSGSTGVLKKTAANTWILDTTAYLTGGSYQPADTNLTAIAALTGTSGLLRKTSATTWSLDTSNYLVKNVSSISDLAIPVTDVPWSSKKITGLADPVSAQDAATKSYVDTTASNISSNIPPGVVWIYGGSTAPSGWLLCDGSAVSRTTYAALFGVIGTTYGAGDGSTTFGVPGLRGKVIVGSGQGTVDSLQLTNRVLGTYGGEEVHSLTQSEMPAHGHTGGTLSADSAGTHTHIIGQPTGLTFGGGTATIVNSGGTVASSSSGAHTHTISGTTSITGSGNAFNIMQPFMVLNYIIKY